MFKRGLFVIFTLALFISVVPIADAISYGVSPPTIYSTVREGQVASEQFNLLRDSKNGTDALEVRATDEDFIIFSNGKQVDFTEGQSMVGYIFEADASKLQPGSYEKSFEFVQVDNAVASMPGVVFFLGVKGNLKLTVLSEADYHAYIKENIPVVNGFNSKIEEGVLASAINLTFSIRNSTHDQVVGLKYSIQTINSSGKVVDEFEKEIETLKAGSLEVKEFLRLKSGEYDIVVKIYHDGEEISENKYPLEIAKRDHLIDYLVIGAVILAGLYLIIFIRSRRKMV